ncbi:hypothetical protein M413DRAFT_17145 [Hebeloma cylindrosporum]|uniref:Peptidase S54 rhomboid domain-containing protein n=1 Tax=Hebeloma cylindrosporum TaxID=76867 RepID=A0A0C3CCL6_HEBCY|nr:hypothetical protein M413DRAFT_17145 [Hebeloma cylindrosporum h7]
MSFENAAVSKGLIATFALTSIFAGIFDIKHYFHLQFVPHISRHHQYWRLLIHHLAFSNSSDLFLAELILYNVGVQIERQFGSIKFASFTFVSLLVSTLLELVSLLLFHRVGFNHISLGPSALIFSILYQYSRIVPPVYAYRIFGVPLNNKSVNYFLALQLAISRLPSSLLVAFIGILSGQIYRSDLAGLNSYRLPLSIIRLSERVLSPLIGSLRPPRRSNRALPDAAQTRNNDGMGRNEEVITTARTPRQAANTRNRDIAPPAADLAPSVMREWVDELTGRADRENVGLRVPTDAEITHLTSMFPTIGREVIVAALQRR